MDLAPGTMVTDNVRLVSLLGEGGMGSVWTADHLSLKTRVAVKFVSEELIERAPSIVTRFEREAALCAQIKSPHVVQMFDHGVMEGGRPYIVMELLDGESLQDKLDREQRLSPDVTGKIIKQTAKALAKAHAMNVVHRDIKPDNLFLNYEDDEIFLKVLDFGIAKQTGVPKALAVTGTGVMIGTPQYMSPEQVLSSKTVDFRADLWALAVVAYHCLTGAVPFAGETLGSLCVAIARGSFSPPSSHSTELPSAVDHWFKTALAPSLDDRHESAKQLAQTFEAALQGHAIVDHGSFAGQMPTANWTGDHFAVIPTVAGDTSAIANAAGTPSTFTGTSVKADRPSRTMKVAVIGTAATLVIAGVVAAVALSGDEPPRADGASASAATASPANAEPATPAEQPAPSATAAATQAPSASATATPTAAATTTPATQPKVSPRPTAVRRPLSKKVPKKTGPPKIKKPAPAPVPTHKDRGF